MPGRQSYRPVVSQAQRSQLFALAHQGQLSLAEARGKARAAKGRRLPTRVRPRKGLTRGRSPSRRR